MTRDDLHIRSVASFDDLERDRTLTHRERLAIADGLGRTGDEVVVRIEPWAARESDLTPHDRRAPTVYVAAIERVTNDGVLLRQTNDDSEFDVDQLHIDEWTAKSVSRFYELADDPIETPQAGLSDFARS